MEFNEWIKKVDVELESRIGVTSDDCRDRCWFDEFEAGCTPVEAIAEQFGGDADDVEAMMREELSG